jgi:hypothetical protein
MNLSCSYEIYLLLGSLLASWALSTFFEGLIWHQILKRQLRYIRVIPILGYMSFIQVISTPLSFGIAISFYALLIRPVRVPLYSILLHLGVSLASNPWGVFIGFFIIPILLEFWFWRSGVNYFVQNQERSANAFGALTRWQYIGASTIIANSCTFLLGMMIGFSVYIGAFFHFFTSIIALFMIGVFFWFLCTTPRKRDWENQHLPYYRMQFLRGGDAP